MLKRLGKSKRRLIILFICFFMGGFFIIKSKANTSNLTANIISVGRGDAIFLEFPDCQTMLIDGGGFSAGDSVISFIKELGYNRIDYMVLTHRHGDHVGGLIKALDAFKVGELWMSDYFEETPLYMEFMSRVEESDLTITRVYRGDEYEIGNVTVRILNPPKGSSLELLGGPNGAAITIRLEYEASSILLAADIGIGTDRELVKIFGDQLKSTVLKCAHHGSEISNSRQFLNTVKPQIAVVSTGPSKYNYPSETTMARIKKIVPDVYRTDLDGTITVILDGEKAVVVNR